MRLFWAINLPPELKRHLYSQIKFPLSAVSADLKWVEEQNIHLTLQFLGDVESGRAQEIYRAVQKKAGGFGQLMLEIKGVGCFPERKPPKVFWAGLGGHVKRLGDLQRRVQEVHTSLGFKPEKRPFSPHITLARFRSQSNSAEFLKRAGQLVFANNKLGFFTVETVDLMQSTLSRGGPVYKVLETVML